MMERKNGASAQPMTMCSPGSSKPRLPDMWIVVVGHPLGGADEATVIGWADAAVEPTLRLLSEPA